MVRKNHLFGAKKNLNYVKMQILFPFSPNLFYHNIDESQANLFNAVGESWRVSKVTDHIIMSNYYEQQLQKLKA